MSTLPTKLSASSVAVLEMIATGSSYGKILAAYPDLTYVDIFHAAEEALLLSTGSTHRPAYTLKEKRERYPRAYEKWTNEEDGMLRDLVLTGSTIAQIAGRLQRNRGAIRSRVIKLNLVNRLTPREQERLHRIVKRNNGKPGI
jgi:hypothetical protein